MPTLEAIKTALFSLINKDAQTENEKAINNLLLDAHNEIIKLLKP